MDKVLMSHLISFSSYQTKCVKFLFRQSMTKYILSFFLAQPLKQWLTRKRERKTKTLKFKYLKNEKSFLDEIKNILQFLKSYHLMKDKNLIKNSGHKL